MVSRVDRVELAGIVGLDDAEVGPGAVGDGDGVVGAERDTVGDGACATGVGEDGGVDGEDISHGEERGGTGSELSGEGGVALGELEPLANPGTSHVLVETSEWLWLGTARRWLCLNLHHYETKSLRWWVVK